MQKTVVDPLGRRRIRISISTQRLWLLEDRRVLLELPVSTGLAGTGQCEGSGQTPLGRHRVRALIGAGLPVNSVFCARRPTGEIWTPELDAAYPGRDWILSRIIWLCGCEPGFNRLGNVDTQRRYIYLHGTPPTEPLGTPRSHGCIRLDAEAIVPLFDAIRPGIPVDIEP